MRDRTIRIWKEYIFKMLKLIRDSDKGDIVIDDMHLTEKDFDVDAMRNELEWYFSILTYSHI